MASLRRVIALYGRHFNDSRPHQGLANRVPREVRDGEPAPKAICGPVGEVHCDDIVGGLLKSYRRAA